MIYLDNNATTRIDTEVLEAMLPYLEEDYGNASSIQHKMGRKTHLAVEESRATIAKYLKVDPKEIYFTSGSTEAITTVIQGIYDRYRSKGNHIITCATEHKAVLANCEAVEKKGAKITYIPVNQEGELDLEALEKAINKETILVCLMSANNETGILHPIRDIAILCQEKGVLFFCDATQSIGKHSIDLASLPIDLLCFSAHKFHGPKGIGVLYVRRKSRPIQIEPLIIGGKQENGLRGGTYNTASIVGAAKAITCISDDTQEKVQKLRDYFEQRILNSIEDCSILSYRAERLNNTSNIFFKYVSSAELMVSLPDVACSSGSACMTATHAPSSVLKAMHLSVEEGRCCVRFSFSKYNSKEEVDMLIPQIENAVCQIRASSPIWKMYKEGLIH